MHACEQQKYENVAGKDHRRQFFGPPLLPPQAMARCQGNKAHRHVIAQEPGKDGVRLGLEAEQDDPPFHDGQEPDDQRDE